MRMSLLRIGFLGFGAALAFGALTVASSALVACESLSKTSPLASEDASDLDTGFVFYPEEEAETPPPPPSGDAAPPPASARVRLANLIQGIGAIDLCVKRDDPTGTWEGQKITVNPPASKPDGLLFGEVSTYFFVPVPSPSGTKYQFRVVALGSPCEGEGGAPLVTIAPTAPLRQGGGVTLAATGIVGAPVDAGDSLPRGAAMTDVVAPPATAALLRVFHGVPDLPAFDVVINGETVLTGVKYASAIGFPYTSTTGFATLPAGVPEKSTLTLRAGTTAKSYTIPERVRRGVAMTVFVGGSLDDGALFVSLCADRRPESEDEPLSTCTKLKPQ